MLIFDGTYTLARKEDPGTPPAHACAWRVRVVDLGAADRTRRHIRPYAVLAQRSAGGIFKSSCAESLGRRVCRDFDLTVPSLLWVESFPDLPDDRYVAVFTPRHRGSVVDYSVSWRPILANEARAVAAWWPPADRHPSTESPQNGA